MRYTIQVAGRAILLGGVAQLGERSVRNAEVASSNLVVSTVWTVFGLSGAVLFDLIKLPGAGLCSGMPGRAARSLEGKEEGKDSVRPGAGKKFRKHMEAAAK